MDLHDELERAGEAQTRDSAERLGSADLRALLDSRVRRGRRRRDAGIGTMAAVAVGAIALGAANLPGWGDGTAHPAATPWAVEPTPGGAYEFAEPTFNLAEQHEFECGAYLQTEVPVVIHDEPVMDRELMVQAALDEVDVVQTGSDAPGWWAETSNTVGDPDLVWSSATAVVRGGEVVGAGDGGGWSGGGDDVGRVTAEDERVAPLPGECDPPQARLDGTYTQVYVVQVADLATSEPLATFTFTKEVTYEGLEEFWREQGVAFAEAPDGSAVLRGPEGDTYQAFLVPRPNPGSCTPLNDQRAMGQPGIHNIQYEVTIPGVQPITGEVWGSAPAVVIEDSDYTAWYKKFPAAIIADEVNGGNPTATVAWTTGTTWGETGTPGTLRLINHDGAKGLGAQLIGDDCWFTLPIPSVSGAVFLVIGGADWVTLDRENPGISWASTDGYTWVYLGQAE